MPKAPIMGWESFWPTGQAALPCIGELPQLAFTTSGRAALLAALRQLRLPVGSTVLVPTYHCPTMVAPVLQAGLQPAFFPIGHDGLPLLDAIDATAQTARVMFVAHYFGLPKSLLAVRRWCDERSIALVEDCAHSYFGQAGDRPVGHWGDYATASLSKFFPVPEGGVLASRLHTLAPLQLRDPGLRAQVKGAIDVIELAHLHRRLPGLGHLVAPLLWLKNQGRDGALAVTPGDGSEVDVEGMLASCDMARTDQAPSLATRALHRLLPTARIVALRRDNFAGFTTSLAGAAGARPLSPELPAASAPYVCPLWVEGAERADAVYAAMRTAKLPIFRWDRIWPGTPRDPQDAGTQWSHQVLQLLCHQDLNAEQIAAIGDDVARILRTH